MSRPPVTVVMPFAGDLAAADAALTALRNLDTRADDELLIADNSGVIPDTAGVTVVRATSEQSPAHARNVGAERARNKWILFLDADCRPPRGLLDAYFSEPIADDVGALAGEVVASLEADSLIGRYGAARSFLNQRAHLEHPYRPRAVAANLLVRRAAFVAIGGFYEGVRAAEDTDFSWRLQAAGWRLELRAEATVEHRYRTTLGELRRQWRGYAAGRAWLARRYDGFVPEPAARRGVARLRQRGARSARRPAVERKLAPARAPGPPGLGTSPLDRRRYLAIDLLLAGEELAGLALSNRPRTARRRSAVSVVLIADRFPAPQDPLAELAGTVEGARVEAAARPYAPDLDLARRLVVDYREDDGTAARVLSLVALLFRHPLRCAVDRLRRRGAGPSLPALAPAVRRLERDAGARVQAIGGADTHAVGRRVARLAGRRLGAPAGEPSRRARALTAVRRR